MDEIRETTNRPPEIDGGPSRPPADPALPLDSESHAIGAASVSPIPPPPRLRVLMRHAILIHS